MSETPDTKPKKLLLAIHALVLADLKAGMQPFEVYGVLECVKLGIAASAAKINDAAVAKAAQDAKCHPVLCGSRERRAGHVRIQVISHNSASSKSLIEELGFILEWPNRNAIEIVHARAPFLYPRDGRRDRLLDILTSFGCKFTINGKSA